MNLKPIDDGGDTSSEEQKSLILEYVNGTNRSKNGPKIVTSTPCLQKTITCLLETADLFSFKGPQHPSQRAISYHQLMDLDQQARLIFGDDYPNVTMHDINKNIILKCCKQEKSYSEFLNPKGLNVDAFITHCWDGHFQEFVASIREAFQYSFQKPNLWICAFALRQGGNQNQRIVENQIGSSLTISPFIRALSQAPKFVVVRNSNVDLYNRIWCVCELMFAKKLGKEINIVGPDTTYDDIRKSCRYAEASNPNDKSIIDQTLLDLYGSHQVVDQLVSQIRNFHPEDSPTPLPGSNPYGHGDEEDLKYLIDQQDDLSARESDESGSMRRSVQFLVAVLLLLLSVLEIDYYIFQQPQPPPLILTNVTPHWLLNYSYSVEAIQADIHSPQALALRWLLNHSDYDAMNEERQKQLFALATLYHSTNGPDWLDNEGWMNSSQHECEWGRNDPISCKSGTNGSMLVDTLHLERRSLQGPVPPEISLLGSITGIYMTRNELNGPIPTELGLLTNLIDLRLDGNEHFRGSTLPTELGQLTMLLHLRLEQCGFEGAVPTELGLLSDIDHLHLDRNHLTGPIPKELGWLTNATQLWLSYNRLIGTVPSEFGRLRRIRELSLGYNRLTGSVPSELGLLQDCAIMHLDENYLSGKIPSELGAMPELRKLWLNNNRFTPSDIPPQAMVYHTNEDAL